MAGVRPSLSMLITLSLFTPMTLIFFEHLAHKLETKVLQNLHQGCNGLRVTEEVAA